MSYLPDDALKDKGGISLAPMIDFLFLMLAFFATLAMTRVATRDTDVNLVKVSPPTEATLSENRKDLKIINLAITAQSEYRWVSDARDHSMETPEDVAEELVRQYERGILPEDKNLTRVLVRIDKEACWEPILRLIFVIRDLGFEVRPVYEPQDMPGSGQLSERLTLASTERRGS